MKLQTPIALWLIAAVSRLVPLPENVALVTGAALLAALTAGRWQGVAVAVGGMAAADVFLGIYSGWSLNLLAVAISVWAGASVMGLIVAHRDRLSAAVCGALTTSVCFFLLSNFAVWLSGFYGYTVEGLWTCMVAAIPFFQNTLIGDLSGTLLLVGGYLLLAGRPGARIQAN